MGSLDREKSPEIIFNLRISDVTGFSAKQQVQIVVDDVNDNKMKPGTKTIYVWKPEVASSDFLLGRVFVDDPDDWDVSDKSFDWSGSRNPYFHLDQSSGVIQASSEIRQGR